MDVLLDDDEERLRRIAREFFEKECPTTVVRAMEEDARGYPPDLWRKLAEMGWLGFALPKEYGDGAPLQHLGLLLEEMGRAAAPLPVLSTLVPALTIADAGSEAQKGAVLPAVARGDRLLTWAVTERDPRTTPEAIRTVAVRDGDHYVVDGVKLFVENFNVADTCLVLCRTPGEGFALLLVDPATPGVTHTLLPTLAGDKQSEVRFAGVRVPAAANLLGDEREGWTLAERMLERATALTCALIVTWVDGAELLTREALWTLGQGRPAGLEVAAAKAFCNERCQAALRHANQIHAGIAQIKEFDLNLWFRRAAAGTMKLGTTFEHRQRIARHLLEGRS